MLLKCPSCGAPVNSDDISISIFCDYCGNCIKDNESLRRQLIQNEHEIEMEKLHHQQEQEKKKINKQVKNRNSYKSASRSIIATLAVTIGKIIGYALNILSTVVGKALGYIIGIIVAYYIFKMCLHWFF